MKTLDEKIESPTFSVHDYVATHLQQVFLPWPLSLLHLLPDWMILGGLLIIGLIQGCTQDFLVGEEVLREIPSRDNYMCRRRRRRSFGSF